jgi:radical SAM protein with 4Fe4S-binding SPASM domain
MTKIYKNIKRHVNVLKGLPDVIAIEPTNYCNLHCPLCPAHHDYLKDSVKFGYMDMENFKSLIDQIKGFIYHVSLSFRGEPLLHKNIVDMVAYCTENGLFSYINTNGTLLDDNKAEGLLKAGLGRINISFDGLTEETYKKYRVGGDFNKALAGIKRLVDMKKQYGLKQPEIIAQFLILKHNMHEVKDLPEFKKKLGIDKISINRASVPSWLVNQSETAKKLCDEFIPEDENKDSRYNKGKILTPSKRCGSYKRLVVTWDGYGCICNFDNNGDYTFGNFFEGTSFQDIWFSDKNQDWRKKIKNKQLDICKNCGQTLAYRATYLTK